MNSIRTVYFAVIIGLAGLIYDFVRYISKISYSIWSKNFLLDGVIQHKIGEFIIFIVLMSIVIYSKSHTKEAVLQLSKKLYPFIILGGVLNLIAWFDVVDRASWHIWCLILFVVSLVFYPALYFYQKRSLS